MRRLFLSGSFLLLVAAVFFFWQHRFERLPDRPTFDLEDLQHSSGSASGVMWDNSGPEPVMVARVGVSGTPVVALLKFPMKEPVEFLQVRSQVRAKGLDPGKEPWDDGRLIIEWHPEDGGTSWENDLVATARQNHQAKLESVVMSPETGAAVPMVRIENLGSRGDFEVITFEAIVLRERLGWKVGRWFLVIGWMAWVVFCCCPQGVAGFARAAVVSVVWLLMMLYFVIPGPWPSHRPFGGPFKIGEEKEMASLLTTPVSMSTAPPSEVTPADATTPSVPASGAVGASKSKMTPLAPAGEISGRPNFTLELKLYAAKVKEFLHVLLLLAPTFLTACLVGRRPAIVIAILFSFCVEIAQVSFGFGFDWVDVLDLVSDGAGILLALVLHRMLHKRFPGYVLA